MKKKLVYIFTLVLIVLFIFTIYKIKNKNNIKPFYNSLVRIEATYNDVVAIGFGFVYRINNDKTYIVTNYHVIHSSFDIYVYDISNKKTKAKLVSYDLDNDIAVLSIDSILDLKEVSIGNSDNIKKNDRVYILGNPNSKKKNAIGRNGTIIENIDDIREIYDFEYITISSNVDYGNSGSPVFNKKGQIIGMLFLMKKDNKNICLAIPINYIVDFINNNDIDQYKPSLGAVMVSSSSIDILDEYDVEYVDVDGVVLLKLSDESILKKSGLKKGDIITQFNGVKIVNVEELKNELYKLSIGNIISIEYYSNGLFQSITIKL